MPALKSQECSEGITILAICAGGWAKGTNLDEVVCSCKKMGGYYTRKKIKVSVRIYLCGKGDVSVTDHGYVEYPSGTKMYLLGHIMA